MTTKRTREWTSPTGKERLRIAERDDGGFVVEATTGDKVAKVTLSRGEARRFAGFIKRPQT